MKPRPAAVEKIAPPAQRFRAAIEKAQAEGAAPADLVLKLTLGDAAKLKRDRTVSIQDIRFSGGAMHYLGVKVVEGDTAASALVMATPES